MRALARMARVAPLAAVMLAACDGEGDPTTVCPAVVIPAVRVVVTDSATGQPLTEQVRGWAVRGNVVDSLRVASRDGSGRPREYVAYGEAGKYTVVVNAEAYAPWALSAVRVPRATCGVETAQLEARMQPVSNLR